MKLSFAKRALLVAAICLGTTAATMAQGAPKIGIIDLKKAFDGYYKTKQADRQLKERAGDSEKVMKGMVDDFQKAQDEYRKVMDAANDQAIASEEREKRKKNAEAKLIELQDIQKSIEQFRRQTQTTLEEQKRRMRDNILKEIRDVVNSKAKAGNYNFVLDTAGESINQTPFLLYTNGQNDLTEEVLAQINAGAPAGPLDPVDDKDKDSKDKTDDKPKASDKKK